MKYWFRRIFRKQETERQLDSELSFHLEQRIAERVAAGEAPQEARRQAQIEFGGMESIKQECRESHRIHLLETLLQDLRYGVRQLLHSPGFTVVAVFTLAIGIGATAAIFSFVNAVLLKPLPYPHPERIVSVWEKAPQFDTNFISTLNFLDWRQQSRCFQFFSAIARDTVTLTGSGTPEELNVSRVSASYFRVLGVNAAMGRTFAPGEDHVGNDLEVVLSNRVWRSRFGGDPQLIGRKVTLDAKDYTVVGVLPAGSEFDRSWAVMWLPLAFTPANMTRNFHWLSAVARLAPGVTLKQARDQMDTIGASIASLYPDSNKGWGVTVNPLVDQVVLPELRRSLWILLAAVGAVLLIGCANLANLTLARGTDREHEMAIRSALGARRLRLIRQLLTENILLGIVGGVAGLALGVACMHAMKLWLPPDMLPPQANVRMDYRVLLFTMLAGILTGIFFGLASALSGTGTGVSRSL